MKGVPPQPDEQPSPPPSGRYPRLPDSVIAAPGLAGIAGIACLPFTLALRGSVTLPVKIAASACPLFLGSSLMLECVGRNNLDAQIRKGGPAERRKKLSELADLRILGTAAGLLMAARCKLSNLKGWQKWIGLSSIGAGLGELGQSSFRQSPILQYVQGCHVDRETIKNDLATYVRAKIEPCSLDHLDGVFEKAPMGPPKDPEPLKTNVNAFALTRADLDEHLSLGGKVTQINTQNGPHWTATEPGETELKPVAHTNYDWMVPSERVVPELEDHITKLRAHRAKLSTEAQVIWQWLGDKEAQYYQIRDSDATVGYDAEQNKKQLRQYCQALASEHVALWMAVGKIDWIIADTQKRIAQHRQFSKGQYQTTSQCASSEVTSSLSFALERLQDDVRLVDNAIENHAKTIAVIESGLKDSSLPNMPEPIRSSLRSASKTDREKILRELIEEGKRTGQELVVQKAAVEEVLRDGERKAKLNRDWNF